MAYYGIQGLQSAVSSSYKGAAASWCPASNTKRHKWYEFILGATSNPNATDTYIQFDISRFTTTSSLAGSAYTPSPLDLADGTALIVAANTLTGEPAAFGASLFNTGINQRATTRWIAAQESQYLVAPATATAGLELRSQSSTFAGATACQVTYNE
jgi:hypothetical protein